MSEQSIQNDLYSTPVTIFDKYTCYSLGATTVRDLIRRNEVVGVNPSVNLGKKPDVIIVDKDKKVILFLECKLPNELNTSKKLSAAIYQEIHVAESLNAKIYVVTDGENFYWFNPKTGNAIQDEFGNKIQTPIKPKQEEKQLADFINRVSLSLTEDNDRLSPLIENDPTNLAVKIGNILKNINFTTPKDSLYTFVELFLFKYLSDIQILTSDNSFSEVYGLYANKSKSEEEILYKYLHGAREQIDLLFPKAADNTTIINGTIFHASKNAQGEYISNGTDAKTFHTLLKLFKEYEDEFGLFLNISRDFKSKLFETFTKQEKTKQNAGKYFTPLKIVQGMVEMVEIKEGMSICDPACGVGKFLLEAASKLDTPFYYEKGELKKKIQLFGFEKEMDEKGATSGYDLTTILAKANTLIYFSNLFSSNNNISDVQKISNDLLNDTFYSSKTILGTLDKLEENKYDLILANPPYYQSGVISKEAKQSGLYTEGGVGVESLFLEWIIKSLKAGGSANIVLPDGIFNNLQNKKLRKYVKKTCFIESIISLPLNTFFNTPKKTFILTIRKKVNSTEIQNYPIFAYLCNSIGETLDVNRFDIPQNDFAAAISKYVHYKTESDKNNIAPFLKDVFEQDKKLKFLNIDSLVDEDDWYIDNRWTEDEKVELGFKEQANVLTVEEFQALLEAVVVELNGFKEDLDWLKKQ